MEREDLRVRTRKYASQIVRLFIALPKKNRVEVQIIGKQLLRSGTSVAANYREASRARSDAEFISKMQICIQEADESMLWLELLQEDCLIELDQLKVLLDETNQLIAILVVVVKNVKARMK